MRQDKFIRALERLEALVDWANLVSSAAPMFRENSRLRRLAESLGPTTMAVRDLVHMRWHKRHWTQWSPINSRTLLCLIRHNGLLLGRIPTESGTVEIFQVGERRSWTEACVCEGSGSPRDAFYQMTELETEGTT